MLLLSTSLNYFKIACFIDSAGEINSTDQNGQTTERENSTTQESTNCDQPMEEGSIDASTAQETSLNDPSQNATDDSKASPAVKTITITLPSEAAKTELLSKILSPTTSTVSAAGFKNTSTDGPKILNVTSGLGGLITIPLKDAAASGNTKPGQVILRHFGPKFTATGPSAGAQTVLTSSNSAISINPGVLKTSYTTASGVQISTNTGGQGNKPNMIITIAPTNSFEEEMKRLSRKQLEKSNPIDKYCMTPPPEDLGISIPAGGYMCLVCEDSYALESSLTQHMERRSIKILMSCVLCRRKLEFYNKCSMHMHLRSHNMTNLNSKFDAVVSPLDVISGDTGHQQGAGRPKAEVKNKLLSEQPVPPKDSTVQSLLQQARQRFEERLKPKADPPAATDLHIPLKSLPDRCPACTMQIGSQRAALAAHLQVLKADAQHNCCICGMILNNNCQLQVHIKIHSGSAAPWICPECAREFTSYASLEKHLNHSCYHYTRNASFSCKLCVPTKLQVSLTAYRVHLSTVHKNSFYKCINCQLAFRSVDALKMHSSTQHNYSGRPMCAIISKCPLCDTVFTQSSLLVNHLTTHLNTFVPSGFTFQCMSCSFVAHNIKGLMIHNQKHPERKWWSCDICRQKGLSSWQVATHRALKHGVYKRLHTPKSDQEKVTNLTNGSDHSTDKVVEKPPNDIRVANGDTKADPPANDDDNKESTKVIFKRMHRCPGCKDQGVDIFFKKDINLRKHIVRSHPNIDSAKIVQTDFTEYVPFYPGGKQNVKVNVCDQPDTTAKVADEDRIVAQKRKRSKESIESADRIKKLRDDKLSCAKCDFETKDRGVFAEHIEEHKAENDHDSSQCQECGMCFRSKDALKKHLFIRHRIRDVKAYARFQKDILESIAKQHAEQQERQKEATNMETSKDETSSSRSPANPLECKICRKVFESEAVMKVHIRSHGMAYIRTKTQGVVGEKAAAENSV